MKPKVRGVTLSKEMAQKLLDRVEEDHQRILTEPTVKRYLADMDAGNWVPWAAIIVSDAKGRLINGQHVLAAFLRSKLKKLEVTLQTNPDPNAIYGYDHCRKRSLGDDLKWGGVERGSLVAAVTVVLWQYEQGLYKGTAYTAARRADEYPTAAQVREAAKMHPGIDRHLRKPPQTFRGTGVPMAALWAASYVLHEHDDEKAPKFFTSLFEGTDIPAGSPIKVLRESIEEHEGKGRLRNGEALAWVFKAWHAYTKRQTLARPILRKKEPFPELIPEPVAKAARVQ